MVKSVSENDNARLDIGDWKPIPKVAKTVPFGYEVKEEDPTVLYPVVLELEALEKAKHYRNSGYSLREVAEWLESVTGRSITHMGLDKRIKSDRSKRSKIATLREWATRYKEAIQKAYEHDQKYYGEVDIYKSLLDPDFNPSKRGRAESED